MTGNFGVSASKLNRLVVREFRAYGENGSFVSSVTDVQAQAIRAGRRPADDLAAWGYEDPSLWGTLRTRSDEERVPSAQGGYHKFYEEFALAAATGSKPPVATEEAAAALAVLDAARVSALEGRMVRVKACGVASDDGEPQGERLSKEGWMNPKAIEAIDKVP